MDKENSSNGLNYEEAMAVIREYENEMEKVRMEEERQKEEGGYVEIVGSGGLGLEAEDVFYALEKLDISNEDKWCIMRDLANNFAYGFGNEEISYFLESL